MLTTNHKIQFQNYRNFQAYKRKLKGMPYKYVESTKKCEVSPIKDVVDYDGNPFTIGFHDKTKLDFFIRLYTIEYKTKIRILPG